ncbi:hypothetical protein COY28_06335 [Candidatus Woesearchaeota archaeon CG_4_10_14_0_2_um_filter_57_5]|nr:MAG: hypothetical protein AUJ68_05200 [Candidatus Woesearchaeota archaeon CG1_02_57_44]PIZ49427.1 MAG: hypothetical protein COY28_06335 [Candidatus Woesearchaeota archaeon CG_4_10_14_0_2_um_filter_57_5]
MKPYYLAIFLIVLTACAAPAHPPAAAPDDSGTTVTPLPTNTCADSDGVDILVQGTVRGEQDGEQFLRTDSCVDDTHVLEWTCQYSAPVQTEQACEEVCEDGACVAAAPAPTEPEPTTPAQTTPPAEGSGIVTVNAIYQAARQSIINTTATDPDGIAELRLYTNGGKQVTARKDCFDQPTCEWEQSVFRFTSGLYNYTVRAIDTGNQSTEGSVVVFGT